MVKCLVKRELQFTLLLTALQTLELQEAICQSLMAFCHGDSAFYITLQESGH